jgi:DNA-binding NtrC family response regulator
MRYQYKIFVVDDEESIATGIQTALEDKYHIRAFFDAESAVKALEADMPDLVLLDIGLPGMSGLEALEIMRGRFPELLVIMITAYEDVRTVISAMKQGAYDYIIKPLQMDGVELAIANALETIKLRKEVQHLQRKYITENLPCFIGESKAILDVMEFVETVAASPDTPILVNGETGTGKELIAQSIHYRSPNHKGAFVAVNCAAIPTELIESELFGHEKGAFSGASPKGKKGLIEASAGGTLFLDEVGDLSLAAQAKLLRFLELGEFYRVGETRKRRVQTRVVSATNKNLKEMISNNLFRKDLYFRLGVIRVEIPSLNERQEDILPFCSYFIDKFNRKFNKKITGLSPEGEAVLLAHDWSGNVRELKNLIERGVLTARETLLSLDNLGLANQSAATETRPPGDKSPFPPLPADGIDLSQMETAMERYYLQQAYQMAKGNESKAARLLKLNHHTYRYRRKKLGAE